MIVIDHILKLHRPKSLCCLFHLKVIQSPFVGTAAAAVLTIVYLFLYRRDLKRMLEMIKKRRSREEDAAEEEV